MAKVASAGSSFALGAPTVAGPNQDRGGVSRTARFGLHHLGSEHRIDLAGQPNRTPQPAQIDHTLRSPAMGKRNVHDS
jgi:hypothetical protein